MLLDRKRINRWAKWVALGLAIVFGASFVFMGVGTGIDLDWSALWDWGGSNQSTSPAGPQERIAVYDATLAADPGNLEALLGAATEYSSLGQPLKAAEYLETAAVAAPDNADIWLRLANIYMSPDSRDYTQAVRVLNQATSLDPNNAQGFLQLGAAERGAGNVNAAILAWNRYLQLEPEGEMADTVRSELSILTPPTTSATPTTGDAGGEGTATTAGATTTTT
ncbi:MAG: tetratricopeptide repeat protein [Thermoleophilia bacterium]